MIELIPIHDLDIATVREELRDALLQPDPVRFLGDFLLRVDWSTTDGPTPDAVAALLDEAEQLVTAAEEGDVSIEAFTKSVSDLAAHVLNV